MRLVDDTSVPEQLPDLQTGFDEVFERLALLAHRVARRVLVAGGDAENVAAETMARAQVRWGTVAHHADAWVVTVATRLAVREAKRGQRRWPAVRTEQNGDSTDGVAAHVDLARALGRLSRRQRQAVALRYLGDLSDAQCAAAMGCSVPSFRTHCGRGWWPSKSSFKTSQPGCPTTRKVPAHDRRLPTRRRLPPESRPTGPTLTAPAPSRRYHGNLRGDCSGGRLTARVGFRAWIHHRQDHHAGEHRPVGYTGDFDCTSLDDRSREHSPCFNYALKHAIQDDYSRSDDPFNHHCPECCPRLDYPLKHRQRFYDGGGSLYLKTAIGRGWTDTGSGRN